MPSKSLIVRHSFGGGWASDFGPQADVAPDAAGRVVIPFLADVNDCLYELDGGPHEIGGATKVNVSAIQSGSAILGLFDYWRQGTAGSQARRRVLHAGTVVLADTDDGVFSTTLASGFESGKVPAYFTFDDLLIFSSDSTTDVPRSWDQTTAQNLAGTPPRFSFGCAHKNRAWAAGVYANPSKLYYSANTDPEDWTGAGSGSIDIDPNDGDMITGLASHKDELWVFKGPNKGSIHRIIGSAPTGSDGFARKPFVSGLGAAWHNSIFKFGDDLGFVSQFGSVHSLAATAAFGDFFYAALSRPINGWILEHLNYNRLRYISAVTDPLRGVVFITMSIDASSTNNVLLATDYRDPQNIRWSKSSSHKHASLGLFVDTSGVRRVLAGGNDGFVRRINVADRSIDGGTALSFKVKTPSLNYGDAWRMKTLEGLSLGVVPKGAHTMTAKWTRDNAAEQSTTLTQGSGAVLGPVTGAATPFVLNSSSLAGSHYRERFTPLAEEGGEFRSVQYEIAQSGLNQDIELHSMSAKISVGAESMENA